MMNSINEFIKIYKEKMIPQIISPIAFRSFDEILYVREKKEGKKFILQLNGGILYISSLEEENSFPIPKNTKNKFFELFQDHLSLFGENISFEMTISTSDVYILEDVFTSSSHFDSSRKRFNFFQKLFRETKTSSLFEFSLPRILSPHEILKEDRFSDFIFYPFTKYYPLKIE
jgi:hypothetical protein